MIEVEGSLRVEIGDDDELNVSAAGSTITLDVSFKPKRVRSFLTLRGTRQLTSRLSTFLDRRGLTMAVNRDGKALLLIGRGAGDSFVGRLLGLSNVKVFPKLESGKEKDARKKRAKGREKKP